MLKIQPVKNVFLVDDDPLSNLINEKIIQISTSGLKVGTYLDAKEALYNMKQFAKNDRVKFPDIVFLDVNMPEMNGWEFLEELNKFPKLILKGCKVFMLSSSINQDDIDRSKHYKMVKDFISKPLTINKIEALFSPHYMPVNNFI